jgi:hypothetical protein
MAGRGPPYRADTTTLTQAASNTTLRRPPEPVLDNKNCATAHQPLALAMNASIGDRWGNFVEGAVKTGRYSPAGEVVREGLGLVTGLNETAGDIRILRIFGPGQNRTQSPN